MKVAVYLSRAVSWSRALWVPKLYWWLTFESDCWSGNYAWIPLSHAGDSAVEQMLALASCYCRVLLAVALLSHCWLWHDVTAESWWRLCCQVMLAMALPRQRWLWCDVTIESCWRWCCRVDVGCGMMSPWSHAGDDADELVLAVVWCSNRVMLITMLPSCARDSATESVLVVAWWHHNETSH
jgi:hypothetical protein